MPTDIIDTPLFSRDVPVRWWEYPVLLATGLLTVAWFAIEGSRRNSGFVTSGLTLVTFAVGCPVCNKLVLLAVGTSGALGLWAPVQPALAALSLALLTGLVALRWQRRPWVTGSCTRVPDCEAPGAYKQPRPANTNGLSPCASSAHGRSPTSTRVVGQAPFQDAVIEPDRPFPAYGPPEI
ncbi:MULTISPECIES: hypothetical protein [unclassified Mycobacterium]|uniref:hypothetical protein n=1 Tax=unclassified Mycobacterium TaxID=2642494 RepID=UPI0018D258A2|nr:MULTISPECIES: hypothetical protein [unclassified Mycobacterium]